MLIFALCTMPTRSGRHLSSCFRVSIFFNINSITLSRFSTPIKKSAGLAPQKETTSFVKPTSRLGGRRVIVDEKESLSTAAWDGCDAMWHSVTISLRTTKLGGNKTPFYNVDFKIKKISIFLKKSYSCLVHRFKRPSSLNLSKRMGGASTI